MNPQTLARATRKLVRPLRRKLQSAPPAASIDELDGSTLILIAHPDDEVFCSGLICKLLSKDRKVHLVCFTRGEGGDRGSVDPEAKLSSVREEELRKATEVLGVSTLDFLDYLDPASQKGELSAPDYDSSELLAELENLIAQFSVTHLVTHGSSGEYWHPAHLCLHRQARALNRRLPQLQLWTFNAWTRQHPLQQILNQDDPTHLLIDGSSSQEKRLRSLSCHQSQQGVFQRFANGSLKDFITLTHHENYRKW